MLGAALTDSEQIVLGNSATNAWCHLQGAKSLLECDPSMFRLPHFTFFSKIFQYFNVMLALSLGRQPLELSILSQPDPNRESGPTDPVFGCSSSLWPLMHELASVISQVQSGENVDDRARILKFHLFSWYFESVGISEAYFEAMMQIAQAYKYCGLLALRMAIPSIFSGDDHEASLAESAEHDIYQSAFNSLLRVCVLSTPMATLTWPLYIVGRLATSSGDRTVIMHIFSQFLQRHHMKVVDGARLAVTAHWGEGQSSRSRCSCTPVLLG